MVKNNGFTLIEFMIVLAIFGIIGAIFFGAISDKEKRQVGDHTGKQYNEVLEAPIDYIRNDKRTSQIVKLSRHSDGTLWACNIKTKDCYKVIE